MIDHLNKTKVSSLLTTAYQLALNRQSNLYSEYVRLSHRLPISADYSVITAQRIGQLDCVIRNIEDETYHDFGTQVAPDLSLAGPLDLLFSWSEVWIIDTYELLRSAKEYSQNNIDMQLFHDIEIIRISLAKYQIAKDSKLSGPLQFIREGDGDVDEKSTTYDKKDPQRNHHMPRGISSRGSLQWCAIDVQGDNLERWLERRDLSDRYLNYLRTLPKE